MRPEISVSKEYIDSVNDWLESWAAKEDSWAIPQFLKKHGIGWSYFQAMMEISPILHNTFEVVIAGLHSKWLLYAMEKEDLPAHIQKILMKYLRVYDNHAYHVDLEAKKEIDKHKQISLTNYAVEDYKNERLEGLYQRIFSANVNKRGSRKPLK